VEESRDQGSGNREQGSGVAGQGLSGKTAARSAAGEPGNTARVKKKLSYLEAREFASIEQRVEESDEQLRAARLRVEAPGIASDARALQEALAELDRAQQENDALYARWAELTERTG
jgi:ATP-binding cassette subfamily F protein uup